MRPISYLRREDYEKAVLERDSGELTAKVAKAEAAIQQRKAELLQNLAGSPDELKAIAKASRVLDMLKDIAQKTNLASSNWH